MDLTTGITGGIKEIGRGSNSSGFYYYSFNKKKSNPQFARLRPGEIIQGLILEIPEPDYASVRLPIGIYKAKLHGNLHQGDELFFKVEEAQPALVLKIYSVSSYYNSEERPLEEIMRMLDIPNKHEWILIINTYKKMKTNIIRDDILHIIKGFTLISDEIYEKYENEVLIKTMFFFLDSEIEINNNNIKAFIEYFSINISYKQSIDKIKLDIHSFPEKIMKNILNYFTKLDEFNSPKKRISVVI
jgi:hypothetical protein